jgi:hypothetical protein
MIQDHKVIATLSLYNRNNEPVKGLCSVIKIGQEASHLFSMEVAFRILTVAWQCRELTEWNTIKWQSEVGTRQTEWMTNTLCSLDGWTDRQTDVQTQIRR